MAEKCADKECMRVVRNLGDFCREHKEEPMAHKESEFEPPGVVVDVIYAVPLQSIDLSFEPVRSGDWINDESFIRLAQSIENVGQLVPIVVQQVGPRKKPRYRIASGWRRFAAIKMIAEKNGIDNPTIMARACDVGDEQYVIERDVSENCCAPITPPDLATALWKYRELTRDAGMMKSDAELATDLGISRSYANSLIRIAVNAPELLDRWRNARFPLTIKQMERLARIRDTNERVTGYERMVNSYIGV